MNNLIYFPLDVILKNDQYLLNDRYKHNHWFRSLTFDHMPPNLKSRVHQLNTPWTLAPTVCPIPAITNQELDFDLVMDQVAVDFCKHTLTTDRTPYICWSGGIDSTSILVSILKNASAEFLKRMIILLDPVVSVQENSYFFHKFIDKKLNYQDINQFTITQDNYNTVLLVDGEAGNQCMGFSPIHKLAHMQKFDVLDSQWTNVDPVEIFWIKNNDSSNTKFVTDMIVDSIKHSPVSIETVYDFLWWTNFNFKFDDVLLRKILNYTKHLNSSQSDDFFKNTLYRFYSTDRMQIWSMISKDLRREKATVDVKYFSKKYIFDFDHNDLYFANKGEQLSTARFFVTAQPDVFAVDSEFNRFSYKNAQDRKKLGKILERY